MQTNSRPYTVSENLGLFKQGLALLSAGAKKGFALPARLRLFRAITYAHACHGSVNHRRKFSHEPYLTHPLRVTRAVLDTAGVTIEMLIGAVLHDVVEDTNLNEKVPMDREQRLARVSDRFGATVRALVEGMSGISVPSDGVRAIRAAIDRAHTEASCAQVKTIKLADIEDNAASFMDLSNSFSLVWMQEKALQVEVCSDGDPVLFGRVRKQVAENIVTLKARLTARRQAA